MRRRFTMNKGFTEPINIDNYLTIEAHEDGLTASLSVNACEYCVDGNGNWKTLSAGTATESINSGHTLSFRGNLVPNRSNGIGTFTINKKCNLKGNCMSMLFGDNAADNYSLSGKNYAFYKLFYNCSNIVNVSSNFLPATSLTDGCYQYMFCRCKSLTTAPELPATTLANYCYGDMFNGCTSLTKAPALPTTTLADHCYYYMFSECTSLTTAPELPATTLEGSCYYAMFKGCTSLTIAPALPATTLVYSCYYIMFQGCTSLNYIKCLATDISVIGCTNNWVNGVASTGTFVKAPSMTSWETGVSGIPQGWAVENNQEPLTFNILSDGTINWTASDASITKTIDYKLNGGEWVSITSTTTGAKITVNSGDKVQFRGNNAAYCNNGSSYNMFGGSTAGFEVEGNIMSLINSTDFSTLTTLESDYTFAFLFSNCTGLTSAENLILPATPLAIGCYFQMFYGCTSLTTAPALPATTLAMGCYSNMFNGCTKLTTAPELPATKLYDYCYWQMFQNCSSLTTAPALPAMTLAMCCYMQMFEYCSGLTTVPSDYLPATTLAEGCYQGMFSDCTSLTTAPELPITSLVKDCYRGMFGGCSSLKTAPELPATTLANGCYGNMFKNCTSLTTATELPATTLTNNCYSYMFYNCTSLTTAPALPATTLANYCYSYMFKGCKKLNYIKCLATDISASNCTSHWLDGVASTGTFVKAAGMTGWSTGYRGIPTGWTVQNA